MIKIKNWSRYQSYKDRRPPWIRFHRTMLDNYQFQSMSSESRALLPMLWLLACEHKEPTSGIIPYQIKEISFRLRLDQDVLETTIKEIQGADFIECIESVTKPLQDSNKNVTLETEAEPEPETETKTKKPVPPVGVPVCPHVEIIAAYHELLPMMPKVKCWTDKRKKLLKTRWTEEGERQSVDWWNDFFKEISKSNFLTGKTEKPFTCSLEWLLNLTNFTKVVEGFYVNKISGCESVISGNHPHFKRIQLLSRIISKKATSAEESAFSKDANDISYDAMRARALEEKGRLMKDGQ